MARKRKKRKSEKPQAASKRAAPPSEQVKAKAKPKAKAKAKVKVKRQAVERPTRRGVRPVRSVPAPSNPPPPPAEPELVIEAEVAAPQAAPDRPSPFDQRARRANAAPLPWILLDEGFSAQGGIETIDAAAMARLRAHVLRLKGGRFGGGDAFVSLPADADALVHEHLHDWIAHGTDQGDGVARVVLVAHDIMESEATTLRLARHHAGWWLANGVYPIHIIWESGLGDTLEEMTASAAARALGTRDAAEGGVDPILEGSLRALGAPILWSGAKRGAERAFDGHAGGPEEGGGRQLLRSLKRVIDASTRPVEVHLVGFGAGSLFMAQAIRAMATEALGLVRTLALAAPALSMRDFRSDIAPFAGFAVRRLALFTLARDLERASSFGSYRRSFLSLLRGALEEESPAELLGLEESMRRTPDVAHLFGLGGARGAPGEVHFAGIAPDVTEATTLAAFDDDRATLNSMLRRVLDQPEGGIVSYRPLGEGQHAAPLPTADFERRLTSELDRRGIDWAWMRSKLGGGSVQESAAAPASETVSGSEEKPESDSASESGTTESAPPIAEVESANIGALVDVVLAPDRPQRERPIRLTTGRSGRCSALAVGVDRYGGRPLNGATADALLWNETFARLGFATREPLLDADATRSEMLVQIRSMLAEARSGDSVAIFFAGYGTTVRDPWEAEGADAALHLVDALVPVDGDAGALIIGSDWTELIGDAAEGVCVTLILDCSFADRRDRLATDWSASAALTRVANDETERDTDIEPLRRTYPLSDVQAARHVAFRRRIGQVARPDRWSDAFGAASSAAFAAGPIVISASAADESAWERDGYGAFSLAATRVLRTAHGRGELDRLSHRAFVERVRELLAETGQRPELHAPHAASTDPLFGFPADTDPASGVEETVLPGSILPASAPARGFTAALTPAAGSEA